MHPLSVDTCMHSAMKPEFYSYAKRSEFLLLVFGALGEYQGWFKMKFSCVVLESAGAHFVAAKPANLQFCT